MKPYSNIIVTGSLSWDTIMDFPHRFVDYLQKDKLHQINVSFVVNNLEKQMGGTATNIAYGVSQVQQILNDKSQITNYKQIPNPKFQRAKVKIKNSKLKTIILGGLGKDGQEHVRFFKKNNIETKGIVMDNTRFSANGSVITDTADNQIWGFYYGACDAGERADFKTFVDKNSLLIISANHPRAFMSTQKYALSHHIDYLYDVGMAMSWITHKDLEKGVYGARWLIGNDYEIALILKTLKITIHDLVSQSVNVITTLGEKGVRYEGKLKTQSSKFKTETQKVKLETIEVPAYEVEKVIDPTGAGDAWRGGFMAGITEGYEIKDCLVIGNAVASFAVEHYGTVNYKIGKEILSERVYKIKSQMTNHKLQTNYKS